MDKMNSYFEVSGWIAADLGGTIEAEEKERLEAWLAEDERHRRIYARVAERLARGEEKKMYRYRPLVEEDWKQVKGRLWERRVRSFLALPVVRYAAVVALVFGVGVAAVQVREMKNAEKALLAEDREVIEAGSSKAVLTLAGGEQVVLEEVEEVEIDEGGVTVEKQGGNLTYRKKEAKEPVAEEVFNVLSIPRGGEYRLELADGTRVWVNAGSELKYPVEFLGKERTVYMKGEVYFEVAPDAERPFIVKTPGDLAVKVLGTRFNVSAYEEDAEIRTTLAEGKVEVTDGGRTMSLAPNQQAVFEKGTGELTRREVDASRFVAWKEGKFVFEEERLEDLMEYVSRWYNVEVFFRNDAVRDLRFTGDLEKYADFSTAVRMLEKVSHIKVEIKNRMIFIGK